MLVGGGGDSSGEESPTFIRGLGAGDSVVLGVGDCVALALPLKSLDPLDLDRERGRRLARGAGSGVVALAATSNGASVFSSETAGLSSSFFSSFGILSPSLTPSACMGGRLPSFIRGNDAARLSFATAKARCSAAEV